MAKFQPSAESLGNLEPVVANLRYAKRAIQLLEQYADENGKLPPWVESKVQEAAMSLGMSISYLAKQQGKKS